MIMHRLHCPVCAGLRGEGLILKYNHPYDPASWVRCEMIVQYGFEEGRIQSSRVPLDDDMIAKLEQACERALDNLERCKGQTRRQGSLPWGA